MLTTSGEMRLTLGGWGLLLLVGADAGFRRAVER